MAPSRCVQPDANETVTEEPEHRNVSGIGDNPCDSEATGPNFERARAERASAERAAHADASNHAMLSSQAHDVPTIPTRTTSLCGSDKQQQANTDAPTRTPSESAPPLSLVDSPALKPEAQASVEKKNTVTAPPDALQTKCATAASPDLDERAHDYFQRMMHEVEEQHRTHFVPANPFGQKPMAKETTVRGLLL